MLISEISKKCSLTKKAIQYYEKQGIIHPKCKENGYREYSEKDVEVLKEVALLRKLSISVSDIKIILNSDNKVAALSKCKYQMELEINKKALQYKGINHLLKCYDIEETTAFVEESIDKYFTIKEKLLQAFPGNYAMYLCIHFGRFLNGKIDSQEKENAYFKIVSYLDSIEDFDFPPELEDYLKEAFSAMEKVDIVNMDNLIVDSMNNFDNYIEENKEFIEEYLEIRNSDEFKNSACYKMQTYIIKFQENTGYYEEFIKNMRILSESYARYSEKIEEANKLFMEKYPKSKEFYS